MVSKSAEHPAGETLLTEGGTSQLFTWGEGKVLKLFSSWASKEAIDYEYLAAREIKAIGLPVPQVYEITNIDGRWGIVFERVDGPSMLKCVEEAPWKLFSAARKLADLHVFVHSFKGSSLLIKQKEQVAQCINEADGYSHAQKTEAKSVLDEMPEGTSVCHGDFHPANILFGRAGPVIIDWADASIGHALADVARTSVLFESAKLPPHAKWHVKLLLCIARKLLHKIYITRYLQSGGGTMAEIARWRVPQRALIDAWRSHKSRTERGTNLAD